MRLLAISFIKIWWAYDEQNIVTLLNVYAQIYKRHMLAILGLLLRLLARGDQLL